MKYDSFWKKQLSNQRASDALWNFVKLLNVNHLKKIFYIPVKRKSNFMVRFVVEKIRDIWKGNSKFNDMRREKMCEIYDVSFLVRDRSKKYLILYDLSASNLSFDKKVKILDIMYPSETHEQHIEEMDMSDSNYNFIQSI